MSSTAAPHHQNVIPAAVRASVSKADELIKAQTQEANPEPAAAEPPAPATPPAAEPSTPAAEQTFQQPEVTPPGNENWEQKFRSELGRNKALREELNKLRGEIASLTAQLQTYQSSAPELSFQSGQRLITPEEENEYGQEFMDLVGRRAQEIAAPLQAQLAELKAKLSGTEAKSQVSAREEMLDTLTKAVPNWREINRNEEFLAWLDQKDMFSGQVRADLLKSAYNSNETDRVVRFFESFLKEAATVAPQAPAQPEATKPSLEQLAAPGRAKSATVPTTGQVADKPLIRATDIATFYANVTRGQYRGRDEERQRVQSIIDEAVRDGRVVQ